MSTLRMGWLGCAFLAASFGLTSSADAAAKAKAAKGKTTEASSDEQFDKVEPAASAEGAAAPAAEGAPAEVPAKIDDAEDRLANFVLQRGAYVSADLGMFVAFGGLAGNSNAQPFLALHAGFDINDYFSVQATMSGGYVSGNAPSEADDPNAGGQQVQSYDLLNFGGEIVASYRPTERFALEPRFGGGVTRNNPAFTDPNDVTVVMSTVNPHIVAGLDLEYLTLLTDFSAGASFTFYYILGPNIPALGSALSVRYTF